MRWMGLWLAVAACEPVVQDSGEGTSTEEDIAAYEALKDELNQYRTEFLPAGAMGLASTGERLFWQEYPGWNPRLLNEHIPTGARMDCGEVAGTAERPNWRGSDTLTAWAELYNGRYQLVDPATCELVDILQTPSTDGTGVAWWAYDVDGEDLLVVVESQNHEVQRYTPTGVRTEGTLGQAGIEVAELWDIGIDGQTMMVIESGRLWHVDVPSWTATWTGNSTEVLGPVDYSDEGALFVGGGLFWWERSTGELRDVGTEIEAADYLPNPTYATAHHFAGEAALKAGSWVIYGAERGIFAYDLVSGRFEPILLDERDNSILYRNPQLAGGLLFVESRESSSGAVGAEGRSWRVEHPLLAEL